MKTPHMISKRAQLCEASAIVKHDVMSLASHLTVEHTRGGDPCAFRRWMATI